MPQHEFMELLRKLFGKRFGQEEREQKSKAKIFTKDWYTQKAEIRKTANTFAKKKASDKSGSVVGDEPVLVYLMEQAVTRTAES
jgi:hypothetical protein